MAQASKICLVLTEKTLDSNIKIYQKYKEYCDLVELRADFLNPEDQKKVHILPSKIEKPQILTFRKPEDGGHFTANEKQRIQLMEKALAGEFKYIDLEENFNNPKLESQVKQKNIKIIRSFHDFTGIPENLESRIKNLARNPQEIPKAAVMANSSADLLKIFQISKNLESSQKILLAMGPFGFPSRILASHLGSYLTYSSDDMQQAAPGHVDPKTLCETYGFKSITSDYEIYGIIGNPVMHSLSPKIHNRGFRLLKLPKVYLPFQVDILSSFFELANLLNIKGISVTIPHKEAVRDFLDSTDEAVQKIGACNTVNKKANRWCGTNTDAMGFLIPLRSMFQKSLKHKKATLIGAGGSAKAVCFALNKEKMDVLIINRTKERAQKLAEEWKYNYSPLDKKGIDLIKDFSDVIIQTTSIGMTPHHGICPIEGYEFTGHELAYDIVYKPPITEFLRQAQEAGCSVLNGEEMLKEQAYLQFKSFTDQDYPHPENLTLF